MERVKMEERKQFTKDDKVFILDKSKNKWCHCGKKLSIGDNFTVEHVIPLSKGGTNEPWNIVALCKDCNTNKSNDILDPLEYYKYLNKEYLNQLNNKQCEYYKNVNWLDRYNFTKEDRMLIKAPSLVPGAIKQCDMSKKFGTKLNKMIFINFIMEKAQYKDLDEILSVYKKYMRKFNIDISQTHVHRLISEIFSKGVIYIIRNSSKEIVGVLPMALVSNGVLGYILKIFTPAYSKPKVEYFLALTYGIDNIIDNIFELKIVEDYVPILLDFCSADGSRVNINKSMKFKVDSMYNISGDIERVMSEIAVYMRRDNEIEVNDYNKLLGGFSNNLVAKYNIKTNNIINCRYDYWRD